MLARHIATGWRNRLELWLHGSFSLGKHQQERAVGVKDRCTLDDNQHVRLPAVADLELLAAKVNGWAPQSPCTMRIVSSSLR